MFSTARNTQRDLSSWVEKKRGRGEIEAPWWRKRRVKRWREQSGQWSHSQVKLDTEDWVLNGTKLITNTKKQRLKILSRGEILKNTILKKNENTTKNKNNNKQTNKQKITQSHRNYKIYIYEVWFKNRVFLFFLCKVIVGYKNEN